MSVPPVTVSGRFCAVGGAWLRAEVDRRIRKRLRAQDARQRETDTSLHQGEIAA